MDFEQAVSDSRFQGSGRLFSKEVSKLNVKFYLVFGRKIKKGGGKLAVTKRLSFEGARPKKNFNILKSIPKIASEINPSILLKLYENN